MHNDDDEDYDDGDNDENDEQRSKIVSRILAFTDTTPDLLPDDWIAVDVGSTWFPGQFMQFDAETEELQVNFLHRSESNPRWFVWPLFQINGVEDKSWVSEECVFYRLNGPREGRRETLVFDEQADIEKSFNERKSKH